MPRFLSKLFGSKKNHSTLTRRVRPALEALEDRLTPAASAYVNDGTLFIIGTEGADRVSALWMENQDFDSPDRDGGPAVISGVGVFFSAGAYQPAAPGFQSIMCLWINNEPVGPEFVYGDYHTIVFRGNGGDDKFFSTDRLASNIEVHGGRGNDRLEIREASARVTVFGDQDHDTIIVLNPSDINRIEGGDGNDTIIGSSKYDSIRGGEGDDVIDGQSGGDDIYGERGNDMLTGGIHHASFLDGGENNDTLLGGHGVDTLIGGSGNDLLFGQENSDWLYGNDGDDTLQGGVGDDTLVGGIGRDVLHGDENNDRLYGDDGEDTLQGGTGDDELYGQGGLDVLHGGENNDYLSGGDDGQRDVLYGEGGADIFKARYSAGTYARADDTFQDFSAVQGDRETSYVSALTAQQVVSVVNNKPFAPGTGSSMFAMSVATITPVDATYHFDSLSYIVSTAYLTAFDPVDFGFVAEGALEVAEEVWSEMPADEVTFEEPVSEEVIDAVFAEDYVPEEVVEEVAAEDTAEVVEEVDGESLEAVADAELESEMIEEFSDAELDSELVEEDAAF